MLIPYVKYTMRIKSEKRADDEHGHEAERRANADKQEKGKGRGKKAKIQRTQAEKGLHLEQYDRECYTTPPTSVLVSPGPQP